MKKNIVLCYCLSISLSRLTHFNAGPYSRVTKFAIMRNGLGFRKAHPFTAQVNEEMSSLTPTDRFTLTKQRKLRDKNTRYHSRNQLSIWFQDSDSNEPPSVFCWKLYWVLLNKTDCLAEKLVEKGWSCTAPDRVEGNCKSQFTYWLEYSSWIQ